MGKTVQLILSIIHGNPVEGCHQYFSPAKTGNLKDPLKIEEKKQEHYLSQLEQAAGHSLFGTIQSVKIQKVGSDTIFEWDSKKDKIFVLTDYLVRLGEDPSVCRAEWFGPHPTTQLRLLRNTLLRYGVPLPEIVQPHKSTETNPYHYLCTVTEGEYPIALSALGLPTTGCPIADTHMLCERLGLFS